MNRVINMEKVLRRYKDLLERRTDLRHSQELLGHSSSKTTEIYTRVSKKTIDKIRNPMDDIFA